MLNSPFICKLFIKIKIIFYDGKPKHLDVKYTVWQKKITCQLRCFKKKIGYQICIKIKKMFCGMSNSMPEGESSWVVIIITIWMWGRMTGDNDLKEYRKVAMNWNPDKNTINVFIFTKHHLHASLMNAIYTLVEL